jgi:hypothetical protein
MCNSNLLVSNARKFQSVFDRHVHQYGLIAFFVGGEEQPIEIVRKNPELLNLSRSKYKDVEHKDDIWYYFIIVNNCIRTHGKCKI